MLCLPVLALEVYQVPSGTTAGIDLLGQADTYYTDRLKGRNDAFISGEVTHSHVTLENPFLLIGSHTADTLFCPATKLDVIPLKITDGGFWKYVSNDKGNANFRIRSGYGNLELEKGTFTANAILLYGEPGEARSMLSVTNGCALNISTTIRVGLETSGGSASGMLIVDGGNVQMGTVLEMGRGPSNGTATYNDSVNTVVVANATMNLTAANAENAVYMGRFGKYWEALS